MWTSTARQWRALCRVHRDSISLSTTKDVKRATATIHARYGQNPCKAGIPRRRHGHRHRHGHPRQLPREDRREDVGVSGDFPVQLATGITSFSTSRIRMRILADLSDTRFSSRVSSRGCPLEMCACTRVLYTFTKLHDRRIPNVGVRVGPVEFQLNVYNSMWVWHYWTGQIPSIISVSYTAVRPRFWRVRMYYRASCAVYPALC